MKSLNLEDNPNCPSTFHLITRMAYCGDMPAMNGDWWSS